MADQGRSLSKTQLSPTLERHSPQYKAWILKQLGRIAVLMREEITQECLLLTVDELLHVEPYRLDEAFRRVRKELRFFPRPCEILERLPTKLCGLYAEKEAAREAAFVAREAARRDNLTILPNPAQEQERRR